MSKKYALTLDLKDDPQLIKEYEAYHQKVWPEILESIKNAGIQNMEIFRWKTRLFMLIEADEGFSFEKKAQMDADNPKVQEWENLMWKYQKGLPGVPEGEKWQIMDRIF
ncbi:L-rhamnose mutarotase [Echinicola jeungdonensis]|uniref:L-rhamnose mutarotase n=1 Tax=Echinicola jeungdonensis TaxID=709343 RepID=A0ABV5J6A4_9BACT|nr:L-rhamnose mutarotase [Echinicola jeungdonensis]MDN3670957.1 L-rhamnose mutarotase [Echinicola jeungdonensis]